MGRSQPTYRDRLRRLESEYQPFERALRRDAQQDFGRLFDHGRNYADAAGIQNEPTVLEPFLLSVCLGQQRELRELRERVAELEDQE